MKSNESVPSICNTPLLRLAVRLAAIRKRSSSASRDGFARLGFRKAGVVRENAPKLKKFVSRFIHDFRETVVCRCVAFMARSFLGFRVALPQFRVGCRPPHPLVRPRT